MQNVYIFFFFSLDPIFSRTVREKNKFTGEVDHAGRFEIEDIEEKARAQINGQTMGVQRFVG